MNWIRLNPCLNRRSVLKKKFKLLLFIAVETANKSRFYFRTTLIQVRYLLIFISMILSGIYADTGHAQYSVNSDLELTKKEQAWLKAHPLIRMGVDANYAPYSFRDESGNYRGIALEFSNYLSKKLGIKLEVVPDLDWPAIESGVQKKNS